MVSEFTMKNASDKKYKTTNPPNPPQVRKNFVILILITILIPIFIQILKFQHLILGCEYKHEDDTRL